MTEPTSRRQPDRPLPRQATMGLLDYITATSLDEDYAHVAAQKRAQRAARAAAGEPEPDDPQAPRRHLVAAATLAAFGLLLVTAAVQTSREAPARQQSREALTSQIQQRRSELDQARAEVAGLRADIDKIQANNLKATAAGRELDSRLTALGLATGAEAARGPGVRIVVDDSPASRKNGQVVLDEDLQRMVNGLWASGAEAIAINGQRVTNLTAIRTAGDAITVNFRSLSRPYVVQAIGDPDRLPARFIDSDGGSWWLNLRSLYDMRFDMTSEDSITVPAATTFKLRHARVPGAAPRSGG